VQRSAGKAVRVVDAQAAGQVYAAY